MAIIFYSLMWFALGLLIGGIYEKRRQHTKVGTPSASHNIQSVPCVKHKWYHDTGHWFKCYWCSTRVNSQHGTHL